MKRTGFRRPVLERRPAVAVPLDPKFRRAVSTGPAELVPIAKTAREENAHYRAMARDRDCQLLIPGVCSFDRSTVVLAHSNWHDKGAARKASDFWGVWACYSCHAWLDQGKALEAQKKVAFSQGLQRMQRELRKLVDSPTTRPRDREAAQWALERIEA